MKRLLASVILFSIFSINFSLIGSLTATPQPGVVINEIAWMGAEVEGVEPRNWWRHEWIELYNNSAQPVSLNGWAIELYQEELIWRILLEGLIQPNSYFLVVSSDKIFPNFDLNYSNLGGKFINSGERVIVKDSQGNIVDEIDCFSDKNWFAGDNQTKQTMERINPNLPGSNPDNWQTSQNPGGTPGIKNSSGEKLEGSLPYSPKTSPFLTAAVAKTPRTSIFFPVLLIAMTTAVFSVLIIFYTKKKLKIYLINKEGQDKIN